MPGPATPSEPPRIARRRHEPSNSDCEVPNQQSKILHEALQAAGATSTFNLVPGMGPDEAIAALQMPIALAMVKSVFGR